MRKILAIVVFLNLLLGACFAATDAVVVYSENNKFGLMKGDVRLTEPIYLKLINLKDDSYICLYKNKFGIISKDAQILVKPKYKNAERFVGRFAKLGLKDKYVLYDENGNKILDDKYSDISLLYGRMFLVKKNYKYGLTTFDGDILLAPIADDIYMPKANVLMISLDNVWYEIQQKSKNTIELPNELELLEKSKDFTITTIVENPVVSAGYGVVSAGDYFIKMFSSISPSYEATIDELLLSHGADTANILLKSWWFVRFPMVYTKNYINNFKTPNNGPLSDVKTSLKEKIN